MLLAIALRRRGHWRLDTRLVSRIWRIAAATIGMGVALWIGLTMLRAPLAHPTLAGVAALAGVIALGGAVYALLGMVLGVIRLSELRAALRRPRATASVPDAPP